MSSKDIRETLAAQCHQACNRLTKWRRIFAARMLGVNTLGGPIASKSANVQAVSDLFEKVILLRAEQSAMTQLLIEKNVFNAEEFTRAVNLEATRLAVDYEQVFPGMRATDDGISMDAAVAQKTMANWGA